LRLRTLEVGIVALCAARRAGTVRRRETVRVDAARIVGGTAGLVAGAIAVGSAATARSSP
jgi:hypothetical protein